MTDSNKQMPVSAEIAAPLAVSLLMADLEMAFARFLANRPVGDADGVILALIAADMALYIAS